MHNESIFFNPDIGVRFYQSTMQTPGFVPFHWHLSIEIVYVQAGKVTFTFNNDHYELNPQDFIVIPSGEIHSVSHFPNKSIVLQIPLDYLDNYIDEPQKVNFKINPSQLQTLEITSLFEELLEIYNHKDEYYQIKFHSKLLDMLFIIFKCFSFTSKMQHSTKSQLQEIIIYINEHYKEKISIKEVSGLFSYSPNYLDRIFKNEIGITPTQYIYQLRMASFYKEILSTDKKINTLLDKNGLTNRKKAINLFKETFNTTPSELRRESKNG